MKRRCKRVNAHSNESGKSYGLGKIRPLSTEAIVSGMTLPEATSGMSSRSHSLVMKLTGLDDNKSFESAAIRPRGKIILGQVCEVLCARRLQ